MSYIELPLKQKYRPGSGGFKGITRKKSDDNPQNGRVVSNAKHHRSDRAQGMRTWKPSRRKALRRWLTHGL